MRAAAFVLAVVCFGSAPGGAAWAQGDDLAERARSMPVDDASFGPVLTIERIEVAGNRSTAERLIRRALPIHAGDVLRAGDPRIRRARFKVLALGFFRTVELDLRKGSSRGKVIMTVIVVERGTVILNRLWFGTTRATPWWAGADVTERNFLGLGVGVGGGFVYARGGDIEGDDDQWAAELRAADDSLFGTALGGHLGFRHIDAREPYRVAGAPSRTATSNFLAFPYSRTGVVGGVNLNVTPLTRVTLDARLEAVDADLPRAPTRVHDDGTVTNIDLGLRPGSSRVATLSVGFDRDTRADPVLPYDGDRLVLLGELGATFFGGTYNYASALARYERWWPVRTKKHVVSLHITGGLILGDAPLFERLHVSDFNEMLTPRALGLVVSTQPSRDFLNTSTADVTYGEVGGAIELEYSYRLFRNRHRFYGGDLFFGAGLWGLGSRDELQVRDRSLYRSLPIDLVFDVGLRLDTEIGIFELTLANGLGRVPF